MENKCKFKNCRQPANYQYYKFKPYCNKHYKRLIMSDFNKEYQDWNDCELRSTRFDYLLGRIYEEFWSVEGPSYLSKARIQYRAFNFKKTESGCEFEITRHPGAWTGKSMDRIVELWRVDLKSEKFVYVSKRKFREGDVD